MAEAAAAQSLLERLPPVRGRFIADQSMAALTWFRVGGLADVLFIPEDAADLAHFLEATPEDIPVMAVGVGSNLLVRDGGIAGVVVRQGKGLANIASEEGARIRVGAGALDLALAKAAAGAGVAGLEFYCGIPGSVGGALRMNAGSYGTETCDVLVEAVALDRHGVRHTIPVKDMGFAYRKSSVPPDYIFVEALFQGEPGNADEICMRMEQVTSSREATQPIRERTGGSTFKNPDGEKAWQLIDAAGCRGLSRGDAQVSALHCNFLINRGKASAADLEGLGEDMRKRVKDNSNVDLHWEIKRVGRKVHP
ncbi:UDP-N-acetylmuramate dehydrogenase [bacterium AH-315-P15]|nr:UDP-N-acetylmuramate dehydrogenase [bacterium AH-315-P15]